MSESSARENLSTTPKDSMVAETVARNVLSQVLSDGRAAGVFSQVIIISWSPEVGFIPIQSTILMIERKRKFC